MQNLIDDLSRGWRAERSLRQMTLGKFIVLLEQINTDEEITGLGELDSYRGYYCDLAFSPKLEIRTIGEVLGNCRNALGGTYTGYKGGDFVMNEHTPLWISPYGSSTGKMLVGLDISTNPVTPITKQEE